MEISEIKERLSILTVLNHYALEADRNGMIRCPFHTDDKASLKIYPDTGTFHCFGCGKNGDQIEFCTLKEGDKHQGLLKATALTGEQVRVVEHEPKQQDKTPPHLPEERTVILTRFFESFKNGLNHPVSVKPKEYLKRRNLNPEQLEAGYNSGQFHHHGKLSEADREACIRAGLLIPYTASVPNGNGTTCTPFAKECIIFPLKDSEEQIVGLYGRGIQQNADGTGKHYYLKERTGLYPGYPKPDTTKLILTEAIIDAATLMQYAEGVEAACQTTAYSILACYGTNGLTQEHRTAIKGLTKLEEIIFFFDGDRAGIEAVERYSKELMKEYPTLKLTVVTTPEGEDINSLLQGHDANIFTHLLENRSPLFSSTEKGSIEEKKGEEKQQQGEVKDEVHIETHGSASGCSASKDSLSKEHTSQCVTSLNNTTLNKLNTHNPDYITFTTEELQSIILGGINLGQIDRLRTTIKISRRDTGDPLHSIRHTLDLYHSDYLEKFINKASEQLETGTNGLRRALAELTEQIEQYRLSKIESRKQQKPLARQLSEAREKRALRYLKAPKLLQRTNEDIGRSGVIGEEINRLLMYLVFTSRLREYPLHIVSLGASGTGKTYLQEKVSELIPEEHKLEITILSENAFYYFDRKELKHKLVLIEDMDGAQEVLYPLRELQTKRKISKTIPLKDNKGNLRTITLHVEGPICLAGTTTKERLYEDNANRSLLIYIDNSHEHKELIMEYQRKLSAGKIDSKREHELKEFFKDMQSVLKPISVRNPYAELLKLPEHVFKPLRSNAHYLSAIETITFYHQYQREVKRDEITGEQYIETTLEDIEWANRLLREVLLAKSDELSGECRGFFEQLKAWLRSRQKTSFFASGIRESFRMNPNNLKYYLIQLVRYGYIKPVGGDRYKRGYEYEVVNFEEYNQLNTGINSVFDEVLQQIRKQLSG
jgi:DNA primase catalytic core